MNKAFIPLLLVVFLSQLLSCNSPRGAKMVFIEGGSFMMGDVFEEGEQNERPIHRVTLEGFFLSPFEVTVGEFEAFVAETGYETSAEGPFDPEAHSAIMEEAASGELSAQEMQELHERILRYSGAGYWDAEQRQWKGYSPENNWKNPGFDQAKEDPVLSVSWDDALNFCNWLSAQASLPVAYDLVSGELLDENGETTTDVRRVRGYRLPTEAEWEYAAREGGRRVRFGNGRDTARSSEMNFRGDEGEQAYLELDSYYKRSMPVGTFQPNSLGLHDMSGNAWEWVSDTYAEYASGTLENPYITEGTQRILRGGRWGGDAFEARVSHRTVWPRNDRCNNSGFRIARSQS